jgi:hypothetical protein
MRTVRSYPLIAHWVDAEPLDDAPAVMAKIEDRIRHYVVDGEPCATGVVAIADSWACTNPSVGRGASIGMMHAQVLRDHLRKADLDDRRGFVLGFDEATKATVEPWYRATLTYDRHRLAEMQAEIDGVPYETDDISWEITHAMQHGVASDPDVLRAFMRIVNVLETPDEVLAETGIFEKVLAAGADWRDNPAPGPTRAELLSIVAG